MIDICTLGTGGSIPMPERALASLYVRCGGRALLLDCGEGTQMQIAKVGWGYHHIEALLITHYHADHCSGIPGFLLALAKAGRTAPLDVWGPFGLQGVMAGLRVIAPQLPYELMLHELSPGLEFQAAGFSVECFALQHGMPCLGYRFTLPRASRFDAEKAKALQIPLPLWKVLQHGHTIEWDGRVIQPDQVSGPPRKGITFVYATDTRPVPAIVKAGMHSQLMILEGMYGDDEKKPQAIKNHHMLFRESAALAAEAHTEKLLLTHFSTSIKDPTEYLPFARSLFLNTDVATDTGIYTLKYPV